ncbi:MAG: hypothetical protein D6681_07295, partial [Calditrichaeota bacterium]
MNGLMKHPLQRSQQDYCHSAHVFQMGLYDGACGQDQAIAEILIDHVYDQRKEEEKQEFQQRERSLISRKKVLGEKIRFWKQRLDQFRENLLQTPEQQVRAFSWITAFIYVFLGIIFYLGEVGVLMDTVANALGLPIDWEEMSLADPSSYAGLMLALALGGIPFVAVKLWMDRYICETLYEDDPEADRWFRWLFIPVAILAGLLTIANGSLRWVFQAMIMDPERYDDWQNVFTPEGGLWLLGLSFMILMVSVIFLAGGISLSIGLMHLRGCAKKSRIALRRWAYQARRWRFIHRIEPVLEDQISQALGELESIEQELKHLEEQLDTALSKLEKEQEVMKQMYRKGYQTGKQRNRQMEKQQESWQQRFVAQQQRQAEEQRSREQEW